MTQFNFDLVIDRNNTGSLKWDRYAGRDILPMWVADMDFLAPPVILAAMDQRLRHGIFGYTQPTAAQRQTVCDYLDRRHRIQIEPDWIVWLPGCVPALSMACACVGHPGDRILTCPPIYPPFLAVHRDSGRELDTVPLRPGDDGKYCIDWDAMERAIRETTRVWLFCNPHNPVGRVFTRDEMNRVVRFCEGHDLLLCSDEIHSDLILNEQETPHVSALSYEPIRDRTIVLMAVSKTFNVPGLACAFCIVPNAALRGKFIKAAGKLLSEITPFGYVATEAALSQGEPWRQELVAYLQRNRDRIAQFLQQRIPELKMTPLEATYLAWLDARQLGHPHPTALFEQHGVGLSDGASYGAPGFVRMNFGCPLAKLELALTRLEAAVHSCVMRS